MLSRFASLALIVIAVVSQEGCCSLKCWPFGKTWCGSQCGDLYWNEWFSLPPDCCDPCNNCGSFVGPNNRFLRRGVSSVRDVYDVAYGDDGWSGDYDAYSAGGMAEAQAAGPEPIQANPPMSAQPEEELPPADRLPAADDFGPMEEVPLSEPSAGATYNEFGEVISYNEPVDSQPRSRKLGKSPQSRLVR